MELSALELFLVIVAAVLVEDFLFMWMTLPREEEDGN